MPLTILNILKNDLNTFMKKTDFILASRNEHLNNPALCAKVCAPRLSHFSYIKEQLFDNVTQRVISQLKKVDRSISRLSRYKISDFSLENLQISGAINNLAFTTMSHDSFTTIANLSRAAESILSNPNNE